MSPVIKLNTTVTELNITLKNTNTLVTKVNDKVDNLETRVTRLEEHVAMQHSKDLKN